MFAEGVSSERVRDVPVLAEMGVGEPGTCGSGLLTEGGSDEASGQGRAAGVRSAVLS